MDRHSSWHRIHCILWEIRYGVYRVEESQLSRWIEKLKILFFFCCCHWCFIPVIECFRQLNKNRIFLSFTLFRFRWWLLCWFFFLKEMEREKISFKCTCLQWCTICLKTTEAKEENVLFFFVYICVYFKSMFVYGFLKSNRSEFDVTVCVYAVSRISERGIGIYT